jgi:regulator of replication initiation timing
LNLEELQSKQSEIATSAQELVNENLRLEGEHRALGKLIESLQASAEPTETDAAAPTGAVKVPVTEEPLDGTAPTE